MGVQIQPTKQKQRELEETILKLKKRIKELKEWLIH